MVLSNLQIGCLSKFFVLAANFQQGCFAKFSQPLAGQDVMQQNFVTTL